jgi:hypothetical protein
MKKGLKRIVILGTILSASMFIGCGGNQPQPKNKNVEVSLPWVDFCNNYTNKFRQSGGIAACSCDDADTMTDVDFSKDVAVSEARNQLASILEVKVASLMEGYRNRVRRGKKSAQGSNFEKTIKEVVNQNLKGSYPVTYKIFRTEENKFKVCSVVAFDPKTVKKIIAETAQKSKIPEDTDLLYEEFKSEKAQQKLNREIGN